MFEQPIFSFAYPTFYAGNLTGIAWLDGHRLIVPQLIECLVHIDEQRRLEYPKEAHCQHLQHNQNNKNGNKLKGKYILANHSMICLNLSQTYRFGHAAAFTYGSKGAKERDQNDDNAKAENDYGGCIKVFESEENVHGQCNDNQAKEL